MLLTECIILLCLIFCIKLALDKYHLVIVYNLSNILTD